jgi:hypothetical protein
MTRWMVELDHDAGLGVLSKHQIAALTAIEDELAEAGVGQHADRALSVSLEVQAPSTTAAAQTAERRIAAALAAHGLAGGQVIGSTVQTLAGFNAEQARPNYPELVPAAEAAEILGVSRQRVHQLHP